MSEFNDFRHSYKTILNADIGIFGNVEYFAWYKARLIYSKLGENFSGTILDYGCGPGLVSKYLRALYPASDIRIVCYDTATQLLEEAAKEIKNVEFIFEPGGLKRRRFDAVIMANILHHVPLAKRKSLLQEIGKITNKNAKLFVFEHNPFNPLTRHLVKQCALDKDAELLKLKDVLGLFKETQITTSEKRYIVFFPACLRSLSYLEHYMGGLALGAQHFCVGNYSF